MSGVITIKSVSEFDRARRYYKNEVHITKDPLKHRAIKKQEYEDLLAMYDPMNPHRFIWEILWHTGLRPCEVVKLQVENFNEDFTQFMYVIRKGKREVKDEKTVVISKSRHCYLPKYLAKKIETYVKMSFLPYGFLFPSPYPRNNRFHIHERSLNREMNRVRPKLGGRWLEKNDYDDHYIAPHSFRRSWITRWINETECKNPFEATAAIGHEDPRTTMGYFQHTEELEQRMKQFSESSFICPEKQILV